MVRNRRGRGDVGVRGHDHLVAWGDAQAHDGGVQRGGTGVGGYAVRHAEVLRPVALEADDGGRVGTAEQPPVEDGQDVGAVLVGDLGPLRMLRRIDCR